MFSEARMRRLLAGAAVLSAFVAVSGTAAAEEVEARMGLIFAPAVPLVRCGGDVLAADQAVVDSGLNISVIHSSQLGSELEMVQQISSGELELALGTSSILAAYVEGLSVFETYYLYDNPDQVLQVHSTEVAAKLWQELLETANIRRIGTPWLYGVRHVFGNRALRGPDDFAGLRLRVPQTAISIASAQALGASPTPTTYGELYLALQQGIVDAAEAPAAVVQAESFYEPADYFNMTGHLITAVPVIVNEDFWQSLTPEQQAALEQAAHDTAASVRTCVEEADAAAIKGWKETKAIEVVEDVDRAALKAKVQEFYSQGMPWSPIYKELIAELAKQ